MYCHLKKLRVGQAPRLCNLPSKYIHSGCGLNLLGAIDRRHETSSLISDNLFGPILLGRTHFMTCESWWRVLCTKNHDSRIMILGHGRAGLLVLSHLFHSTSCFHVPHMIVSRVSSTLVVWFILVIVNYSASRDHRHLEPVIYSILVFVNFEYLWWRVYCWRQEYHT